MSLLSSSFQVGKTQWNRACTSNGDRGNDGFKLSGESPRRPSLVPTPFFPCLSHWQEDRTGRLRTIVQMYECCGPQCVTSFPPTFDFLLHPRIASSIARLLVYRHTRPLNLHRTNAPRVPECPSAFLLPTARRNPTLGCYPSHCSCLCACTAH